MSKKFREVNIDMLIDRYGPGVHCVMLEFLTNGRKVRVNPIPSTHEPSGVPWRDTAHLSTFLDYTLGVTRTTGAAAEWKALLLAKIHVVSGQIILK